MIVSAAHELEVVCLVDDAVAGPDVFTDLSSGLRVESGISLDLLSADGSMFTSSDESGYGAALGKVDA